MPRGRHRQSSPLSRLLPPTACGVLAIASLISAAFTGDPVVLRVLVVAASVGAFAGAVLLRLRESAGQAELEAEIAARSRDEARFEDRTAELEYLAETAEEQVKRLERQLLAQRSQLARAEGENARLLRERARIAAEQALRESQEAQRREVAARGIRPTPTAYLKAVSALRTLEHRAAVNRAQRIAAAAAARTSATAGAPPLTLHTPAAVPPAAQPNVAAPADLRVTSDRAVAAQAAAAGVSSGQRVPGQGPAGQVAATHVARTQVASSQLTAAQPASQAPTVRQPAADAAAAPVAGVTPQAESGVGGGDVAPLQAAQLPVVEAPIVGQGPAWARAALPPMRPAAAVLPTSGSRQSWDLRRQSTATGAGGGTFNFFSRQEAAISNGLGRLGDLADVVGDEAAAAQQRYAGVPAPAAEGIDGADPAAAAVHDRSGEPQPQPALVDLTADDETEPIDVRVLRDAL